MWLERKLYWKKIELEKNWKNVRINLPVECRVLPFSVLSTVQVLSILINQSTDLIQAITVHIVEKVSDLLFGE